MLKKKNFYLSRSFSTTTSLETNVFGNGVPQNLNPIFRQPKKDVGGNINCPSHIIARRFQHDTLMECFPWAIQVKLLFPRTRYHNLIKIAHAFPYYGHAMVQCMTCMQSYYNFVFFDLLATIGHFGALYDFHVFIDHNIF